MLFLERKTTSTTPNTIVAISEKIILETYKLFPRNLLIFLLLIKYKYTTAVSNPGANNTPYSVKIFIDEYPKNTAILPNTPNAISKIHKIIFFLIFLPLFTNIGTTNYT